MSKLVKIILCVCLSIAFSLHRRGKTVYSKIYVMISNKRGWRGSSVSSVLRAIMNS